MHPTVAATYRDHAIQPGAAGKVDAAGWLWWVRWQYCRTISFFIHIIRLGGIWAARARRDHIKGWSRFFSAPGPGGGRCRGFRGNFGSLQRVHSLHGPGCYFPDGVDCYSSTWLAGGLLRPGGRHYQGK